MKYKSELIVCYDVAENKERRRFRKELLDLGLRAIQKSVFWGRLTRAETRSLRRIMNDLDSETDKAFVVPVQLAGHIKEFSIGYPNPDLFEEKRYIVF